MKKKLQAHRLLVITVPCVLLHLWSPSSWRLILVLLQKMSLDKCTFFPLSYLMVKIFMISVRVQLAIMRCRFGISIRSLWVHIPAWIPSLIPWRLAILPFSLSTLDREWACSEFGTFQGSISSSLWRSLPSVKLLTASHVTAPWVLALSSGATWGTPQLSHNPCWV